MKQRNMALPLLVLGAALLMAPAALAAEPQVVFDGNTHELTISPAYDLFGSGAKGMLPGGSYTGTVTLLVQNSSDTELLFRAEPAAQPGQTTGETAGQPSPADPAAQLHLLVELQNGSGEREQVVFDGPMSTVQQDWVSLGHFSGSTDRSLVFTVTVPAELGNEYQNAGIGQWWHFWAKQASGGGDGGGSSPTATPAPGAVIATGTTPTIPRAPQTGDNGPSLWLLAAGLGLGAVGLWVARPKQN